MSPSPHAPLACACDRPHHVHAYNAHARTRHTRGLFKVLRSHREPHHPTTPPSPPTHPWGAMWTCVRPLLALRPSARDRRFAARPELCAPRLAPRRPPRLALRLALGLALRLAPRLALRLALGLAPRLALRLALGLRWRRRQAQGSLSRRLPQGSGWPCQTPMTRRSGRAWSTACRC